MDRGIQAGDTAHSVERVSGQALFFPVGVRKFFWLSLLSLGYYQIYWLYVNWKSLKEMGYDASPLFRTAAAFFFTHILFRRIEITAKDAGIRSANGWGLAMAWIATILLIFLPDFYWFISYLAFLWLLPVQRTINAINEKQAPAGYDKNEKFSGWNKVLLVVGAVFWVLMLIGTLMPEAVEPNAAPAPATAASTV